MSQFAGGNKVRCVDCSHLSGNMCGKKDISVSPKKRRTCEVYEFRGEYQNRTPAHSVYVPHVDKATRKMIKRLIDLGIVPVREDGSVPMHPDGSIMYPQSMEMPRSTATASVLGVKPDQTPLLPGQNPEEESGSWTPDDK